jgi:hypothetical protein
LDLAASLHLVRSTHHPPVRSVPGWSRTMISSQKAAEPYRHAMSGWKEQVMLAKCVPLRPGCRLALCSCTSIVKLRSSDKSINIPPSRKNDAAQRCPPERIAILRPRCRANRTALTTSSSLRGRAMTWGYRGGTHRFHILLPRASSYPASSRHKIIPVTLLLVILAPGQSAIRSQCTAFLEWLRLTGASDFSTSLPCAEYSSTAAIGVDGTIAAPPAPLRPHPSPLALGRAAFARATGADA